MLPRNAETVVATLQRSGELWQHGSGLTGLRGAPLQLLTRIDRLIARTAREFARGVEWQVPAALSFESLAQAEYFASFPQWLTVATHLSDDAGVLERVARADQPANAVAHALMPAAYALPPAVCYHVYAALQGRVLEQPMRMTTQATCWRHESNRHAPLERGWAFSMREIVQLASSRLVERFRQRGLQLASALADALRLDYSVEQASDPFFAPTARGKALLQNVKALKHELLLPIGERTIAAASFNHHERFFGAAFDISLPGGQPASSGCVAFGLERWLLAFLVRHGTERRGWPELPQRLSLRSQA